MLCASPLLCARVSGCLHALAYLVLGQHVRGFGVGRSELRWAMWQPLVSVGAVCVTFRVLHTLPRLSTQIWACCKDCPLGSRSRSKFLCLDAGVCFAQAKSAQDKAGDYTQAAKDKAGDLTGSAKDNTGSAQDKAGNYAQTAKEKTSSAADTAGQKVR